MEEKRIEKYVSDEKTLWQGKAKENDYLTCRIANMFPLILIWLAAEFVILGVAVSNKIFGQDFDTYYLVLTIVAVLCHLAPTVVWLSAVVRENARIRGEEYAVTESRVAILHSTLHESVEYIPNEDVTDVVLRRSLAETIFGTGRIIIITDEERITLYSIENASKAFRKVYRAILGGKKNADE
ncbi:MAG: PH domain-containing protein [Clostridia bacterium]|nr:PH domain-containing protein [Clostridia bacterium]